uniref:Uncharacterized protein n=3 Tax=Helianthus annuus TaxID=4232 RepID=A0A251UD90_HELAN
MEIVCIDFVVESHMNSCFEMDLIDEILDGSVVISLFKNLVTYHNKNRQAPATGLVVMLQSEFELLLSRTHYSTMSSSSGVSDLVAVDADDPMYTDSEVHTSDTDSTDEDAFQPFAILDFGDDIPHADGVPAGDLPLVEIPAPVPHVAFPAEDLPPDVESDDDLDLFEGPPEDHHEGGAQIADDVAFPLVEIPDEEAHSDSLIPDSPESVASSVPPPIQADIPAEPDVVAPFPDPVPLEPDHALFAAHVDPQYADTRNGWIEADDDVPPFVVPVAPALSPFDAPLFPTHTADAHRTDLPITFLQEIPPPRPGEGPSHQPFGHAPFLTGGDQFAPQIP